MTPPSNTDERANLVTGAAHQRNEVSRWTSFVCFVSFVAAHSFHSRTAWQATARLLRELDSTCRKMLGLIGEGLPILTRQPWPALDQTSQLGIGFTRLGPERSQND